MQSPTSPPPMFQKRWMEFLSRTNLRITGGAAILYAGLTLTWAGLQGLLPSLPLAAGLFVGGMFSWTLAEYLLHRYLFHLAAKSAFARKLVYVLHGHHHDYPGDQEHLLMPPVPMLGFYVVFLGLFYLVMGTYAFLWAAGFLCAYVLYASMHYAMHKRKPPKIRYFQLMWRHHNIHHFRHEDKAFGVSSPFWDYVFGTMPPIPNKGKVNT